MAGYPSKYDCETVIFGPKLSFSVVTKEMLTDEQAVEYSEAVTQKGAVRFP